MFVLITAVTSADDFVGLGGAKLVSLVVLVVLVVVLVVVFAGRSAPLSRWRGVRRRQAFDPRVSGVLYGAAFTALFAPLQLLLARSERTAR